MMMITQQHQGRQRQHRDVDNIYEDKEDDNNNSKAGGLLLPRSMLLLLLLLLLLYDLCYSDSYSQKQRGHSTDGDTPIMSMYTFRWTSYHIQYTYNSFHTINLFSLQFKIKLL